MKRRHLQRPIPKAKKFTPPNLAKVDPLPSVIASEEIGLPVVVGTFTGLTVEVCDPAGIERLALGGCFGQGTLSRSFPASVRDRGLDVDEREQQVVRRRQLDRRKEWAQKYGGESGSMVTVMEEDVEEQLEQGLMKSRELNYALVKKERDPFPVPENLSLIFEEAVFLMRELKCLEVRTLEGDVLSEEQVLDRVLKIKRNFLSCYVSYVYLKAKNWVIKTGLKFGGDFLLYQKGPQFFHASYIVLVQPYQNSSNLPGSVHYLDNYDFQSFNRIAETTAKDLLVLEVHFPVDLDPSDCKAGIQRLKDFKVSEIFPRHHNYAAHRNSHQQQQSSSECK